MSSRDNRLQRHLRRKRTCSPSRRDAYREEEEEEEEEEDWWWLGEEELDAPWSGDKDRSVRRAAAEALGQLGVKEERIIQALLWTLGDEDEFVRRAAARALDQMKVEKEEMVQTLLGEMKEKSKLVRWQSLRALGYLGVEEEEVVEALRERSSLLDGWWDAAPWIEEQRGIRNRKQEEEGIVSFLKAPEGKNRTARQAAAKDSTKLRPEHDPQLQRMQWILQNRLKYLKKSRTSIERQAAVEALGQLGIREEKVIQALLNCLRSESELVFKATLMALHQLGVKKEEMIPVLLERLRDKNVSIRLAAIKTLSQLQTREEQTIQALLQQLLEDEDEFARWAALRALGQLGTKEEEVIRAFLQKLKSKDQHERQAALKALDRLEVKEEKVIQALLQGMKNAREEVLQALLERLEEENELVRWAAVKTLGQMVIREDEAIHGLLKRLGDGDKDVRKAAAEALYRISRKHGVKVLFPTRTKERAMGTLEDSEKLLILERVIHLMERLAHDFIENNISVEKFNKNRAILEKIYQCHGMINTKECIEDLYDTALITEKEMESLLPEEKYESKSESTVIDTYYDKVIKNLHNLKKLAFFHPRIAFLGVASEIENVFREIDRYYINQKINRYHAEKWADSYDPFFYISHPETRVILKRIRSIKREKCIPDNIERFMDKIDKLGGDCRHQRIKVSISEVEDIIDNAIDFMNELKTLYFPQLMECPNPECKTKHPFYFENVLNAVPGSVLKLWCKECNTLLFEYVIPDPGEPYTNSIIELIDSGKIKNATTDLIKVIKEISVIHYYYACGEEEEYKIMVNLLEVISSLQYELPDKSEQDRRRKAAFSVLTETAQELLKYCYDLDETDEKEIADALAKAKARAMQREFDEIVALARAKAKASRLANREGSH